jgi:hypothetical protein
MAVQRLAADHHKARVAVRADAARTAVSSSAMLCSSSAAPSTSSSPLIG